MHPTCLFPWYPPAQKRLLLGNQAKFAAPREVAPLDEMVFNVRVHGKIAVATKTELE
jgi:hypothetical protein